MHVRGRIARNQYAHKSNKSRDYPQNDIVDNGSLPSFLESGSIDKPDS